QFEPGSTEPVAPVVPVTPWAPVIPAGPWGPVIPVGPCGPVAPRGPVQAIANSAIERRTSERFIAVTFGSGVGESRSGADSVGSQWPDQAERREKPEHYGD